MALLLSWQVQQVVLDLSFHHILAHFQSLIVLSPFCFSSIIREAWDTKKKHFSWFSGASCCLSHFLKMLLHSMTIFSVAVSLSSQTIMLFVGRFASFYTWILAPVATHGHFTSPSWISMGFLKSSSILHILPYEHEPGYIWSVVRKALRWLMAIHLTSPSAR